MAVAESVLIRVDGRTATDVIGSQDWVSDGVVEAGPGVMYVVSLSSDSRCSGELTDSADITAFSGACSQWYFSLYGDLLVGWQLLW